MISKRRAAVCMVLMFGSGFTLRLGIDFYQQRHAPQLHGIWIYPTGSCEQDTRNIDAVVSAKPPLTLIQFAPGVFSACGFIDIDPPLPKEGA